eukprot:GGOE01014656.1.p1 GENE.GGOE01014656.1~~GGOE01014656.1.p1  ORF type:complete len:400 (+),score=144.80 GGOE01014656.1:63-1262(+)
MVTSPKTEHPAQVRRQVAMGSAPVMDVHDGGACAIDLPVDKAVDWPALNWSQPSVLALAVLSPLGVLAHFCHWRGALTFWLNFLPLIPLSWVVAQAAEQVALYTGDVLGGLLTATVGNAAELLFAFAALRRQRVRLVQASLMGSMLCSLLGMTGLVLLLNGIRQKEQCVNASAVVCNSGLLMVGTLALCLPTLYESLAPDTTNDLKMSHAAAATLALLYAQFVYYQTTTRATSFGPPKRDAGAQVSFMMASATIGVLCLVMLIHSELLVRNVGALMEVTGFTERFTGAILLPITSNAAECFVALTITLKGRLPLALGVVFASCTQIAVFVVPLSVLGGWLVGAAMELAFHPFEVVVLHLSVLLVAELLRGGVATWFQGSLLLATYCLVACGFFYLPTTR